MVPFSLEHRRFTESDGARRGRYGGGLRRRSIDDVAGLPPDRWPRNEVEDARSVTAAEPTATAPSRQCRSHRDHNAPRRSPVSRKREEHEARDLRQCGRRASAVVEEGLPRSRGLEDESEPEGDQCEDETPAPIAPEGAESVPEEEKQGTRITDAPPSVEEAKRRPRVSLVGRARATALVFLPDADHREDQCLKASGLRVEIRAHAFEAEERRSGRAGRSRARSLRVVDRALVLDTRLCLEREHEETRDRRRETRDRDGRIDRVPPPAR